MNDVGYKKPPKETRFKKGHVANPLGGPKLPPGLRAITELTKNELARTFAKFLRMTPNELLEALNDPKLTCGEKWIITGIQKGIVTGEWYSLHSMLDRIWGRPKQVEDDKSLPEEERVKVIITLPSNGKEAKPDVIDAVEVSDEG